MCLNVIKMPGFYGFAADTQVLCKDELGGSRLKYIKFIKEGEKVLSADEEWYAVSKVAYINLPTKETIAEVSFDYSKMEFVQVSDNQPVLTYDVDAKTTQYKLIAEVRVQPKKYMVGIPLKEGTYDHVVKACFETNVETKREIVHVYEGEEIPRNISQMMWSYMDCDDSCKYSGQMYNLIVSGDNNFCVASLGIVKGLEI